MKIDILVAEIGSTTTKATAIDGIAGRPRCLGQGRAATTVQAGDVNVGLLNAIEDLRIRLGADYIAARETFACSSAAGGLKMSVHGLVHDMTARAAKEAALGAGANLKLVTSGLLDETDLARIRKLGLNIIMIAGGVDHGDRKTALANAAAIASLRLDVPVVYAGNVDARDAVRKAFEEHGMERWLTIAENVYPRIDQLRVDDARRIIQDVFERHIIQAPGMEKIRDRISGAILPTPGAVMNAALLLQKTIGDLLVADVGGATTDIHSVTAGGAEASRRAIAPEPFAKRTVEGDLGVYVNRQNLIDVLGLDRLSKDLKVDSAELARLLETYPPIPGSEHVALVKRLTRVALSLALDRHAGRFVDAFGTTGKITVAEGKDLSAVRFVIGTGGALARLPDGVEMLSDMITTEDRKRLYPPLTAKLLIDQDYVFAAAGAIAGTHPDAALALLMHSIGREVL